MVHQKWPKAYVTRTDGHKKRTFLYNCFYRRIVFDLNWFTKVFYMIGYFPTTFKSYYDYIFKEFSCFIKCLRNHWKQKAHRALVLRTQTSNFYRKKVSKRFSDDLTTCLKKMCQKLNFYSFFVSSNRFLFMISLLCVSYLIIYFSKHFSIYNIIESLWIIISPHAPVNNSLFLQW